MFCHMFKRFKRTNKDAAKESVEKSVTTKELAKSRSSNWCSQNVLALKDFHYVFSLVEKCLKHIVASEINFKTNPPYLPGILRNFNHKILDILKFYENNLEELSLITFFRVSVWTLIKQVKDIIRIIRAAKSDLLDEFSDSKKKLINISILLSHLFHAIVALFPNSCYSPESFRITKSDAADWWHSQFGPLTTVVEWKDFFHFFSKINYISEVSQIAALRKTINVTGNGFVSIFDFDVFVRLFQPWSNILESWRIIVLNHPGCMSYISYEQVVQLLKSFKYYPGPGSYVFRFSCTKPGQWAIGYIDLSGKIYQTIVHNKSLAIALYEGEQAGIYKFPNGKIFDSSILNSLTSLPLQNITVSSEQHEAYCRIDSSFEICKICEQFNKNIKLEPCGHLLCNFCLVKWQKSFRCQSCPFCRLEIKGIEKISLIPFQRKSPEKSISECPLIPPRSTVTSEDQLSMISDIASHQNTGGKINYAQLEWMSINDSGYCVNSTFEIENNESCSKIHSPIDCDGDISSSSISSSGSVRPCLKSPPDETQTLIHSSPLRSVSSRDSLTRCYMNVSNSIDIDSETSNYSSASMHITSNSEAMKKLLKITGNDVSMSQEILKYFTPRSVSICSNR